RSHQRKRPLRRSHHHQRLSKPPVSLVTLPTTRHRIISPNRPLKTNPAILHPLHRRLSDRGAPVIRKPLKPFLEIVLKLLRREPHPTLTALEVVHIRLNLTTAVINQRRKFTREFQSIFRRHKPHPLLELERKTRTSLDSGHPAALWSAAASCAKTSSEVLVFLSSSSRR